MYGAQTRSGGPSAYVPPQASVSPNGSAKGGSGKMATALILTGAIILYFIWALVERHERVRNAVEPKAIGLNIRNLAAIILPVIIALPLLKVAAAKYKAWGLPGGDAIVTYAGSI